MRDTRRAIKLFIRETTKNVQDGKPHNMFGESMVDDRQLLEYMNSTPVHSIVSKPNDGNNDEDDEYEGEDEESDEGDIGDIGGKGNQNEKEDYDKEIYEDNENDRAKLAHSLNVCSSSLNAATEKLPIFVDTIWPRSYDIIWELSKLKLTSFEHFDRIVIAEGPFTTAICYYKVESRTNLFDLKAIQLYLSTG
ncbi:hypothetical protein [Parasitella parasitica]|uniref:Uncharacterized protein n=1 Tax=Parasitella parasitica TaxID=35722 RepID=A0A0B7MVB8_9FUNG|nr:hypothetical protein [Parasitella parasitica]